MAEPRYQDSGVSIYLGEVRAVLAELEPESVDAIVTSPPYFALRDYGLPPAAWGGDPEHAHGWGTASRQARRRGRDGDRMLHGNEPPDSAFCACGAWLGQLGLEPDPLLYVDHLVEVLRACRRVLKREGTVWLNLGDSYASKTRGSDLGWDKSRLTNPGYSQKAQAASMRSTGERHRGKAAGFKAKDRMLIPARVAIALADDGWFLRDEIVWHKANPMPSSVEDRTTPAHEMVYLLSRSGDPTYWVHRDGRRVDRRPRPDFVWLDMAAAALEAPDEPADWRTERLAGGSKRWRRVNLWEGHDYFYNQAAIRESRPELELLREARGYRNVDSVQHREPQTGLHRASWPGGWDPSVGQGEHGTIHRGGRTPNAEYSDGRVPRGWANGEGRGHDPLVGRYQPARRDKQAETADARASGGDRWTGFNDRWAEAGEPRVVDGGTRNKRSVWTVATQPYAEAHYATFPEQLIEPMILAGTPPRWHRAGPVRRVRHGRPGREAARPAGRPDRPRGGVRRAGDPADVPRVRRRRPAPRRRRHGRTCRGRPLGGGRVTAQADVRRERPTTPSTGDELDVASGGARSTRTRPDTSAAPAGRRPPVQRLTPYGPPLTEDLLIVAYRNAGREDAP